MTMRNSTLQATALALFLSIPSVAADRFAKTDDYVRAAMKRWEVPGAAIAAVQDGKVVFARGYGVRRIGTDEAVTKDTVFSIASCTKSFYATALAMLVEEGRLAWDDPVIKHLPELRLANDYLTKHVTIRDLLCHRTGLRRADLLGDKGDLSPEEYFARLQYLEPIAEPRTKLIYNNHMYVLAGKVLERVSGKAWDEFVRERILQPLDMTSTVTPASRVPAERLARRHWRPEGKVIARPVGVDASLQSSVVDLAKWLRFQLAEGEYDGKRLLKKQTIREMHSMQMSQPVVRGKPPNIYAARFYGAGLGWFVLDYRGRKLVYHGGSWGAWVAMIPEENIGVAVLVNVDLNGLDGMLMYDFLDALLVGPEVAWDREKWKTWLKIEGPEHSYRPRDKARKALEAKRERDTKPNLPLERYTGQYESKLYGRIGIEHKDESLWLKCGVYETKLTHWHHDAFYARAPTRITYDWLLTFGIDDGRVKYVTVKHVGWDADEKNHAYHRVE
jgi:CubicO group peptidase (beta-lactamase class C family)